VAVSRALRSSLKYGAADRKGLAEAIYDAKRQVYVETLADLAEGHGYELDGDVILAPTVEAEIRAVAQEHARLIADSYNRDVDAFLDRNESLEKDALLDTFDAWSQDRLDQHADLIAVTEAYDAYTDATVSFYAENGLEPEYEFGGHPELGDADPACDLCQALEATNPHPHARVLEVGIPHVQCRQNWHALVDPENLPDVLTLGGQTGGVLGADPLNMALGGTDEAVQHVHDLAGQ
jgi:hypothetical protein